MRVALSSQCRVKRGRGGVRTLARRLLVREAHVPLISSVLSLAEPVGLGAQWIWSHPAGKL